MQRKRKSRAKGKIRSARLERRVRVTFFLPSSGLKERRVLDDVINYLLNQVKNPVLPVTGFTYSSMNLANPLFFGNWWSKTNGVDVLILEQVMFFLIDFRALAEEWKFDQELTRLKEEIHACYVRRRCRQEEIWMVKEDVHRYA